MYTIKSTNVQQADSMNAQTNNKTRQEEKSLKFQEISAKNEMISMNFLKKVIQVVTKQYMRLQKQQLAFLVACAVVSAKHIRRFLRDLKIISMFLFTFIIRNDFGQAMVLMLAKHICNTILFITIGMANCRNTCISCVSKW